jgi:hypothetical protein
MHKSFFAPTKIYYGTRWRVLIENSVVVDFLGEDSDPQDWRLWW